MEADNVEQAEMKEKIRKSLPQNTEKVSRNQTLQKESYQRNKHQIITPGNIFEIIHKIN